MFTIKRKIFHPRNQDDFLQKFIQFFPSFKDNLKILVVEKSNFCVASANLVIEDVFCELAPNESTISKKIAQIENIRMDQSVLAEDSDFQDDSSIIDELTIYLL